jgi:hypothetical protein
VLIVPEFVPESNSKLTTADVCTALPRNSLDVPEVVAVPALPKFLKLESKSIKLMYSERSLRTSLIKIDDPSLTFLASLATDKNGYVSSTVP